MSIGRLGTCFGSRLAFYQIRDENRAKFKISYSCGHRVSKSARSDASIRIHAKRQTLVHIEMQSIILKLHNKNKIFATTFKLLVGTC